jgi:hypothetical protein
VAFRFHQYKAGAVRWSSGLALCALVSASLVPLAASSAEAATVNRCWSTDNGDPRLDAMAFTPHSVGPTRGGNVVTFAIKAHDTGGPGPRTGLKFVKVRLVRHGLRRGASLERNGSGTWVGAVKIPRWNANGRWHVQHVRLGDRVGQVATYSTQHLTELGLPTTLSVRSHRDTTPPKLTGFGFWPGAVNTTKSTKTITIKATASDTGSGVRSIIAIAGTGSSQVEPRAVAHLRKVSGSTWGGTLRIPQWAGTSRWHVRFVGVGDRARNSAGYRWQDLNSLGFRHNFDVTSRGDGVAPIAESLSAPHTVNVQTRSKSLAVTVRAGDVKAEGRPSRGVGVASVYVRFNSAAHFFAHFYAAKRLVLTSGTKQDGVWKGKVVIRWCHSEPGDWFAHVTVRDVVGNWRRYTFRRFLTAEAADHLVPEASVQFNGTTYTNPVTIDFNEAVNGISDTSVPLRKFDSLKNGPIIPGSWVCTDASNGATSCADGMVRHATFIPTVDLEPGVHYAFVLNPEHSLGVTDLAGNPFDRVPLEFVL